MPKLVASLKALCLRTLCLVSIASSHCLTYSNYNVLTLQILENTKLELSLTMLGIVYMVLSALLPDHSTGSASGR